MIRKAVFSYFNKTGITNTSGFSSFDDMVYSTALAVMTAKRHFTRVEFVTNDFGAKLIKLLGLPVEVNTLLNKMGGVSPYFWAYGKVLAYAAQNEPFVHIDNDAYILSGLPQRMLEAECIFQSKEDFRLPGYGFYEILKPCFDEALVKPKEIVPLKDYAYNCGLAGGNNTDIFKLHEKCSTEYIFAPENQTLFFEKHKEVLIHQNLFHEQYFLASLIQSQGLRSKTEVLGDDIGDINKNGISFCHLWGLSKRNEQNMVKVKKRLLNDFPVIYDRVHGLDKTKL